MGVAAAVACASELETELAAELERARGERLLLTSANGPLLEARLSERREFEDRAESLQKRLREFVREVAAESGLQVVSEKIADELAEKNSQAKELAQRIEKIRRLATALSEVNRLNRLLAERALQVTKAYVRALAPRPSAYDRRGVESAPSALSSVSRRA